VYAFFPNVDHPCSCANAGLRTPFGFVCAVSGRW
jgi:hypothetical protein